MLILLNESANGGRAAARWRPVEETLRSRGRDFELHRTRSAEEAAARLREGIRRGHRVVVAAGGDGTVHGLLNSLLDPGTDARRREVALGAIGLGSSNDFHKPFDPSRSIADVPARIRPERGTPADAGKAVLECADGRMRIRYFALNASLGLVAEANDRFNRGGALLDRLKRWNVEAAILGSAAVALRRFRPVRIALRLDGGPEMRLRIASLAILKKVHFAGGMRYDTPVRPDDGWFDVNALEACGPVGLARATAALYRGRFRGLPRTRCWRAKSLTVTTDRPVPLETDGEILPVVSAEFRVVPKVIRICG